jgi:hypothetical protein
VDFLGLLARYQGQADNRVFVDPDQATGLTHAAAFLQMLEDREGFLLGQFATVQSSAFAFGKAFLAGATGQDTAFPVGSVAEANAEVVETAAAVVRTLRILTAEGFQVVHRGSSRSQGRRKGAKQLESV